MAGVIGADHDDAEFGFRLGRYAGIRDSVNQVGGLVSGNAEVAGMVGFEFLFPYLLSFSFPIVRDGVSQERTPQGLFFTCSTCCSYCCLHHWGCSRGNGSRGDGRSAAVAMEREARRENAIARKVFIYFHSIRMFFLKRYIKVVVFFRFCCALAALAPGRSPLPDSGGWCSL